MPMPVFILSCLLACYITPICRAQTQQVTIQTPLGPVTGNVRTVNGHTVHEFLGIPYALPPVGQLRFKKPQPVRPWSTPLDATNFRASCPQSAQHDENCLFLNIYVPANDSVHPSPASAGKAVMIWVHGGGFVGGAGRGAQGSFMAVQGDVVVVTVNYRLGMLGWLSTLDQASPGNYGLWDQRLAFQFVQHCIGSYGGNPSQVTIFGESAGGYSVGLHTISPLNTGLFQHAIMQSGNALCRRAMAFDPVGFARKFGEHLGCLRPTSTGFDTNYLVECARKKNVSQILSATNAAEGSSTLVYRLNVAPVVDGELIPADVRVLLGPGYRNRIPFWNIDVIVGTNNAEGSLAIGPLVGFQKRLNFNVVSGIPTQVLCNNVSTTLAHDYFHGSDPVAHELCTEYSTNLGDAEQGRKVVDLYGDMMFVSATVETLQKHANVTGSSHNHFQYLFSHMPISSGLHAYPWFQGAAHGDEVRFVFGQSLSNPDEIRLSHAMTKAWTNFAKFGTPNHPQNPSDFQWPAYDSVSRAFTNLDFVISEKHDIYAQRMNFWLQQIPASMTAATTHVSSLPPAAPHEGISINDPGAFQ